ncbi:hypothetical protein, partial [Larkinella terrae]|uniref:hypothetical protein n=1 Tax=Larkinella terrae TaxID=2025311 RepID=UPI0019825528
RALARQLKPGTGRPAFRGLGADSNKENSKILTVFKGLELRKVKFRWSISDCLKFRFSLSSVCPQSLKGGFEMPIKAPFRGLGAKRKRKIIKFRSL